MKKIFFVSFIIIGLLIISCSSSKNIVLNTNQNYDSVFISAKDTLTIEMKSNPSTGYKWYFDSNIETKKLVLLSDTYISPNSNLIGATGKQIFKFKTKKKGECLLKFYYSRSNNDTLKNKKIFVIIN